MKPRPSSHLVGRMRLLLLVVISASLLPACSMNPATGKRQLNFFSEEQEIAMGREGSDSFIQNFGLYPDEELQQLVAEIGADLAAASERPHLPWRFVVMDETIVNAYAMPGGFIHITREMLAHMNSEAELAAVLGHEIGHVTARHSVNQMSKQSIAQGLLAVGMIAAGPEYAQDIGQLGGAAAQMLFLKYGRDDESQADSLGLRYTVSEGWDPEHIPDVFATLGRLEAFHGGGQAIPNWARSHPTGQERVRRLEAEIAQIEPMDGRYGREEFLARLDGLMWGENPREGYFKDGRFYHPDMAFSFRVPENWRKLNQKDAVRALSPEGDLMAQLTLAQGGDAETAARNFYSQRGIERGRTDFSPVNGVKAFRGQFGVPRQGGNLAGIVAFFEHRGTVLQLTTFTVEERYRSLERSMLAILDSFEEVTSPAILNVKPRRLQVVRASRTAPLAQQPGLDGQNIAELEVINGLDPGESIQAGQRFKIIHGTLPGE